MSQWCEAHIAINIDPEDLDRVGDFFEMIMNNNVDQVLMLLISRKTRLLRAMKKGIVQSIHLMGVTIALVSANYISSYMVPAVDPATKVQQHTVVITPTGVFTEQVIPQLPDAKLTTEKIGMEIGNITYHGEMCQIDLGCSNNVCWRSCHSNIQSSNLWCHTHLTPNARTFYSFDDVNDCFLCWECIEPCHK